MNALPLGVEPLNPMYSRIILLRTAVGVAVPFICKQRWFDVQTVRAPKQ